ncbi:MAG: PQQ-dependent dehydrogenase, methanol/ethanol family [Phenylobacterium sp.]|nr:PQQ-dependent dehydrogenase, methanol/ethanol family [Phenylobacterium sp.]
MSRRLQAMLALCAAVAMPLAASSAAVRAKHATRPPAADWTNYGGGSNEDHYSPLNQINDKTIQRLRLAWSYDIGTVPSVLSAPVAVDGVIYFSVGYSVIRAMDAQTGKLLWTYDPEVWKVAGRKQRALWGIRGIAYSDGKVLAGTLDGRLLAIDAKTGKLAWSTKTVRADDVEVITGPPFIMKDKVIIGNAGAEYGPVRGYVTAYDIKTGKQVWRFYTVPGNPAAGPDGAASDPVMAMAAKTWNGQWWKYGGGGNVWHAMAYDAKFNRVYIGTANGVPWNQNIRSPGGGDNLFLAAIVALDADTGKYVWHYQTAPGEKWDYDSTSDIELADVVIDGQPRSVLLHAPKNGFFYVIDRATGKLISAEKVAKATWADRIDLKTGRPVDNPEAQYSDKPVVVFPGAVGGHAVLAMAYSPATKLAYIPVSESARVYYNQPGNLEAWDFPPGFAIVTGTGSTPPGTTLPAPTSALVGWDPVAQKAAWRNNFPGILQGGALATGGNLVLQGRGTGELVAYAADTGKRLWGFDAQVGVQAQPITYMAGGKQYVTVLAGWRGSAPNGDGKIWDYRTQTRRLLTFVLDGKAKLPPARTVSLPILDDPNLKIDPAKVAKGQTIYVDHCPVCHGGGAVAGGAAPDLRTAGSPMSIEALSAVLKDGALRQQGMPQFEEFTAADIEALQHYIRQQARVGLAKQAAAANPTTH